METEWITVTEVANMLGWCREGVRKAILRNDLVACCRIGDFTYPRGYQRGRVAVLRTSVCQFRDRLEGLAAEDPLVFRQSAYEQLCDRTTISRTGCWEWMGSRTQQGYGRLWVRGQGFICHRVAYEYLVGPIPKNHDLHHCCENKRCWNPSHLQPITRPEHCRIGETAGARNRRATHCKHGHEFTDANTYWYQHKGRSHRACRVCKARRDTSSKNR